MLRRSLLQTYSHGHSVLCCDGHCCERTVMVIVLWEFLHFAYKYNHKNERSSEIVIYVLFACDHWFAQYVAYISLHFLLILLDNYFLYFCLLCVFCFFIVFNSRSSHPEEFLRKGVLKIGSKFTGEHPCGSVISAWVFSCKFAAYFRAPFLKNTSGWLLVDE